MKYLHSAAYRVGESRLHIRDIAGHEARLETLRMSLSNAYAHLGLGYIHTTDDVYGLVAACVAETIAHSGESPQSIDHVLVCSSHLADSFRRRNRGVASALIRNGINPKSVNGTCFGGCVDLLRSIQLACQMLDRNIARNVLVIGLESSPPQADLCSRIVDYALISDGVASCIVSQSPGLSATSSPYEIVALDDLTMIEKIGNEMPVSDAQDYSRTVRTVLKAGELTRQRVKTIFGNNTFLPIKMSREAFAGFSPRQMFLGNVQRLGHCLACDSLINLIDSDARGGPEPYLLYAEAEGHSAAVLLKGCADRVRGQAP